MTIDPMTYRQAAGLFATGVLVVTTGHEGTFRAVTVNSFTSVSLDPTLLLGPWETVAETATWILDLAAGRPGHIFNLGHGVLPETDADVLRSLVDHVHDHREKGR